MEIINLTPENIHQESIFCVKDIKNPGFDFKAKWFEKRIDEGLHMKMAKSDDGKPLAYIEFVPSENAWRPIDAKNYMFIHCMYVYAKKDRNAGLASELLKLCMEEAQRQDMQGVASMTSKGTWITDNTLFLKNGFQEVDRLGRFELMVKKLDDSAPDPKLFNWEEKLKDYKGWHLLYAAQCPWHLKARDVIIDNLKKAGIDLKVKEIKTANEAQQGPSGFGTFALIKDGKLLEDHYLSETRFKTILKKEMN